MEGREGISSGVTVIGAEAPSAYHMAPRSEAPSHGGPPVSEAPPAAIGVSPVSVASDGTSVKKKRGRPRKYGPDGLVNMALSPMPISSSAPFSNNFSSGKRGRPRGMDYKLPKKLGVDYIGKEFDGCNTDMHCYSCFFLSLNILVNLVVSFYV